MIIKVLKMMSCLSKLVCIFKLAIFLELELKLNSIFLGEEFIKLANEDDRGWCLGKIGNKVGLYPATYANTIE